MIKEYIAGEKCPASGVYRAVHEPAHSEEHEITCVKGHAFPSCNHKGCHPKFSEVRLARIAGDHPYFTN